MANSKAAPLGETNEYVKAPQRADQSVIGGAIAGLYHGDATGNVVDLDQINRTKDRVGKGSRIFPGGVSSGSGF